MKRVLFLTDSLSLPRKHVDGVVEWDEVYISLLRQEFPEIDFIHVAYGGATIGDLFSQLNYYSLIRPDLIILHCGIVDCAPRAFGRLELEIIKKFRLFRLFNPFTKFFRIYRGITYTPLRQFEKTLINLKQRFPDSPFWSIGILPGCKEYEEKVPGISRNIEEYNAILKRETYFISNDDFPRSGIINDYHHLNALGHRYIFNKLCRELIKWDEKIMTEAG